MCDAVWVLIRDERLHRNNRGSNEVDVIGWGRDFNATPMRLALSKEAPKDLPRTVITFAPGIVSLRDETGDLGWVDKAAVKAAAETADQAMADRLEQIEDPKISLRKLADITGLSYRAVRKNPRNQKVGQGAGTQLADTGGPDCAEASPWSCHPGRPSERGKGSCRRRPKRAPLSVRRIALQTHIYWAILREPGLAVYP